MTTLVALVIALSSHFALAISTEPQRPKINHTPGTSELQKMLDSNENALLSAEDQEVLRKGRIEQTPYLLGGTVGTLVGFGTGHAIQDRYMDRGWIFTAGELASALVFTAGSMKCTDTESEGNCTKTNSAILGAIAFVGFKIWEIIDLWGTPPLQNRKYDEVRSRTGSLSQAELRPALVLNRQHQPQLGLTLTF